MTDIIDNIGLWRYEDESDEQRRIPRIDLRRIAKYGECRGRMRVRPCSSTSYLDDTHSYGCPLRSSSESWFELIV